MNRSFKDVLSSKCQVSVERIVLDLESEAMGGLGSIPSSFITQIYTILPDLGSKRKPRVISLNWLQLVL